MVGAGGVVVGGEAQASGDDGDVVAGWRDCRNEFLRGRQGGEIYLGLESRESGIDRERLGAGGRQGGREGERERESRCAGRGARHAAGG